MTTPPPIILLTGAGGTGKTTLAKALAERYGVPMLASSSRDVQAEFGLKTEDDQAALSAEMKDTLQQAIADRYWQSACAANAKGEGYVSDRTIGDHFVYRQLRGFNELTEDAMSWYQGRLHVQLTKGLDERTGPLVIYCPIGLFAPPDDGMRTTNQAQRVAFDYMIRGVVDAHRLEINLLPLYVADFDARMQHIHSALLNCYLIEPQCKEDELLMRDLGGKTSLPPAA